MIPDIAPANKGTRRWQHDFSETLFADCLQTLACGQAEYAHRSADAFANFKRLEERMGMTKEQILMVYLEKHMDGIHAFVQGHQSQREGVMGRIQDAIVYLSLLGGMVSCAKEG